MNSDTINSIKFFFFENLSSCKHLYHAVSTRVGGVSKKPYKSFNLGLNTDDSYDDILLNHSLLCNALGFNLQSLVSSRQIHSSNVITINKNQNRQEGKFILKHAYYGFDAIITNRPDITIIIRVADCVPIILFDPIKKNIAVVHAGWKGTVGGIVAKTVQAMNREYGSDPCNIIAGIGPSIGPCCYFVKKDIAELFRTHIPRAESFLKEDKNGFTINLWEVNRLQLLDHGCFEDNIEVSNICTSCNSNIFFSHRREEGKTGRFGLVAGLMI